MGSIPYRTSTTDITRSTIYSDKIIFFSVSAILDGTNSTLCTTVTPYTIHFPNITINSTPPDVPNPFPIDSTTANSSVPSIIIPFPESRMNSTNNTVEATDNFTTASINPIITYIFNTNCTNLVTSARPFPILYSKNHMYSNHTMQTGCVGNTTDGNKSSSATGISMRLVNPDAIVMSDIAFTITETHLITQNATTSYLPTPGVNATTNTTNVITYTLMLPFPVD
ncbi:hypothetical protein APTSU1_000595400 [Apodemus speciosus]|uniref:Uncharacterized protein n=1 Tax=Apodemus speciosus TaxID=105296 RepID=A0ABQ0EUM1_APOSI